MRSMNPKYFPYTLFTVLLIFAIAFLMTCASEGSLSGGPADKTAPTIIFSSPKPEAIQVPLSTNIKLIFSEKMLPATVRSSVRVVPEPNDGFEVKTTWRKLEIRFNSPLKANQTYLVTLDKSATDLHQNGLDGTFVLAFSTGRKLDNGVLAGIIVGDKDVQKKGQLLLYENTDQELDSLRATKAEYTFQPTDSGTFQLPYLVARPYLLFYHWDRNQDRLIDAGDFFGRPAMTTVYPQPDSALFQIRIRPSIVPPTKLKLLGAKQLSPSLIRLRLTRPVAKIQKSSDFRILINNRPVDLLGFAPIKDDPYGILIHTITPVMVEVNSINICDFADTTGVFLNSDTLIIQMATRRDSLKLDLLSFQFSDGKKSVVPTKSTSLVAQFSKPVMKSQDSFMTVQAIGTDTTTVPGHLSFENSTQVVFTPDSLIPPVSKLAWQIDAKAIHGWFGDTLKDSVYSGVLKLISPDSLGRLFIKQNSGRNLRIVVTGNKSEVEVRSLSDSTTIISDLNAGKYQVWAYDDINANGKYDNGGFDIHAAAEPFWVFPEMIHIRARWDYDVGIWNIQGD